jgi:hypothetical protein
MTELVTSGSVGGMASNGCLYPEVAAHLLLAWFISCIVTGRYHSKCGQY